MKIHYNELPAITRYHSSELSKKDKIIEDDILDIVIECIELMTPELRSQWQDEEDDRNDSRLRGYEAGYEDGEADGFKAGKENGYDEGREEAEKKYGLQPNSITQEEAMELRDQAFAKGYRAGYVDGTNWKPSKVKLEKKDLSEIGEEIEEEENYEDNNN